VHEWWYWRDSYPFDQLVTVKLSPPIEIGPGTVAHTTVYFDDLPWNATGAVKTHTERLRDISLDAILTDLDNVHAEATATAARAKAAAGRLRQLRPLLPAEQPRKRKK